MNRVLTWLRKNTVFTLVFIISILLLSCMTFIILCISNGVQQRGIFFSDKSDSFMDFFNVIKYSSSLDPYHCTYLAMSEKAYPPLTYLLLYPFSKLYDYAGNTPGLARESQLGIMSVVVFLVLACVVFALLLYKMKKGRPVFRFLAVSALFSSGIFLFSLERANTIFWAVICVSFFIMAYKNENRIIRELAYIALAVAAAIKIYPALFGILLIYDRRYKDIIRLAAYGIIAVFMPFAFLKGGFSNIPVMIKNAMANTGSYMFTGYNYRFGFISNGILLGLNNQQVKILVPISFLFLAVCILTSWSLDRNWKILLALSCATVLTPVNSGFYCGLYLFVPVILFLNEKSHRIADWFYLILFIFIFSPFQISYGGYALSTSISNISVILIYTVLCIEGIRNTVSKIRLNNLSLFRIKTS